MTRMTRRLAVAAGVLAVLAAGAGSLHAQTVYYYPPAPAVVAPVTTCYVPPPVAVNYYAPPVVTAYPPSVSVTTYR
jgi:hypothetical protein